MQCWDSVLCCNVAVWLTVLQIFLPLHSGCLQECQKLYKTTCFIDRPGDLWLHLLDLTEKPGCTAALLLRWIWVHDSCSCNSCCGETSSIQCLLGLLILIRWKETKYASRFASFGQSYPLQWYPCNHAVRLFLVMALCFCALYKKLVCFLSLIEG